MATKDFTPTAQGNERVDEVVVRAATASGTVQVPAAWETTDVLAVVAPDSWDVAAPGTELRLRWRGGAAAKLGAGRAGKAGRLYLGKKWAGRTVLVARVP